MSSSLLRVYHDLAWEAYDAWQQTPRWRVWTRWGLRDHYVAARKRYMDAKELDDILARAKAWDKIEESSPASSSANTSNLEGGESAEVPMSPPSEASVPATEPEAS